MTTGAPFRELSLVQQHHHQLQELRTERSSWDSHWKDIAVNLLPRRSRFFSGDQNRGSKKNDSIIDSSATFALRILVAGLFTGVTSPARKWFALDVPADPDLRKFGPVKEYLDRVERLMYDIFRASNFYRVIPQCYAELGAWGTGVLFDLPDFNKVSKYRVLTVGEYYLAQDSEAVVETCYRELPMTVRQIVDTYGDRLAPPSRRWANISTHVQNQYERGNYNVWVDTVHGITKNSNHVPGSENPREMPYQQIVYETGHQGRHTEPSAMQEALHLGGFMTNPIRGGRWDITYPDVYGNSPGMDALGDIRQLQDQQRKKGSAIAKQVNPPMTAPSSLKNQRKSTLPGDVTYVDTAQGQQGFQPAFVVQPNIRDMLLDMDDVRQRIRRAFHSDLFLIITERPGVQPLTESEIFERREEKLLALGPVFERLDDDILGPVIKATRERVERSGIAGPRPPDLADMDVEPEYLNLIALAQRSQGLLGLQDTARFTGDLAAAQAAAGVPVTAFDNFNADAAIREFADKRGIPAGVIRSVDEVAAIRQQRQAQEQQNRAMQMAGEAASAAKALGDVDTTQRNLVTDLQNAAAGQGPGLQVISGGRR